MEYSQFGYSPIPGAERLDSEVEQLTHEAQRTLYRDGGGLSTLQNQTEGSCRCSRGSLAGKLPGSPVHSVRQALQVCLLRESHCWAISRLVHQLDCHNPLIHRHPWLFPNRFGKLKIQSRRNSGNLTIRHMTITGLHRTWLQPTRETALRMKYLRVTLSHS